MTRRQTQVVLLCEDRQHEAFATRFLRLRGVDGRVIRVEKAPKGRGSGEQWVRQAYAKEVDAHRRASHIRGRVLVVMIDEDTDATGGRRNALRMTLAEAGMPDLAAGDAVVHAIPARNIETWIAYLRGEAVDETLRFDRLDRQRDCKDAVQELKRRCDARSPADDMPPSLQRACVEFRDKWR